MKIKQLKERSQRGFLATKTALIVGAVMAASTIGVAAAVSLPASIGENENLTSANPDDFCVTATWIDNSGINSERCSFVKNPGLDNSGENEAPQPEEDSEDLIPPIVNTDPIMITTWNTTADNCKLITLPIDSNVSGTVKWGENAEPMQLINATNANTSPTLESNSELKVTIEGNFKKWGDRDGWDDAGCLISVDTWGETGTTDLSGAFRDADNLKRVESIPSTTSALPRAFSMIDSAFTIGELDTSNVGNMSEMFTFSPLFNSEVPFVTSKVTSMKDMFAGATAFNQPINFDDSKLNNLNRMFANASSFNHKIDFNTENVTTMDYMFSGASSFDQPISFDMKGSTTMVGLFFKATNFNSPVKFTNTENIKYMDSLFTHAESFDQPLDIDTQNVKGMKSMFSYATNFDSTVNFTSTSNVTNMNSMFNRAERFNQPLNFDTSKVTDMTSMFSVATNFNQDLSNWDVDAIAIDMKTKSFSNGAVNWVLPKPKFRVW